MDDVGALAPEKITRAVPGISTSPLCSVIGERNVKRESRERRIRGGLISPYGSPPGAHE